LLPTIFVELFEKVRGTSNDYGGSCHWSCPSRTRGLPARDGRQESCERQSHAIARDARSKAFGEFGEFDEFDELFAG
jgi:hypothetical protein